MIAKGFHSFVFILHNKFKQNVKMMLLRASKACMLLEIPDLSHGPENVYDCEAERRRRVLAVSHCECVSRQNRQGPTSTRKMSVGMESLAKRNS